MELEVSKRQVAGKSVNVWKSNIAHLNDTLFGETTDEILKYVYVNETRTWHHTAACSWSSAWTLLLENKISNHNLSLHLKKLERKGKKIYPEQAEGRIYKEQMSVKLKTEEQREK